MKKIPDYFHIGVMKTGTTFLQNVLLNDNRVQAFVHTRLINTNKYFTNDYAEWDYNKISIESDENIIDQRNSMHGLDLSLQRIKLNNPNAKIIITIREQKSLFISAYKHLIRQTEFSGSFVDFLNSEFGIAYIISSNYYQISNIIRQYFPKDQIFFIPFELIKSFNFIEVFYSKALKLQPPLYNKTQKINSGESDMFILEKNKINASLLFKSNNIFGKIERKIAVRKFIKAKKRFLNDTTKIIKWDDSNPLMSELENNFKESNRKLEKEFDIGLKTFNYLM